MEVVIKIIGVITLVFSFIFSSYGKSDDMEPLSQNSFSSSVKIDISHLESTLYKNVVEFYFKSSALISISKIKLNVGTFNDELRGDLQTQFKREQWYMLGGYEGVEIGQQWIFTFYGKEVEANKGFKTTTNYVVNL
jgi:hypothetical protein